MLAQHCESNGPKLGQDDRQDRLTGLEEESTTWWSWKSGGKALAMPAQYWSIIAPASAYGFRQLADDPQWSVYEIRWWYVKLMMRDIATPSSGSSIPHQTPLKRYLIVSSIQM